MRLFLERVVTFSLLFLAMGAFSNLFWGSDLREGSVLVAPSHLGLSVLEVFIYLGCGAFALLYYKSTLVSLAVAWPFLLVNAFAFASTLWSVDIGTTLRRGGVFLGTTVFGIYLGGRYSVGEFQKILLQSFLIMLAASFMLLPVLPGAVLDQYHTGAFRGLTDHKNIFGEYMAILLILGMTYNFPPRWRVARFAVIALAICMELWAHSGTSLLAMVAAVLIIPFLFLLRLEKRQAVSLTLIGSGILGYLFVAIGRESDAILNLMGKDRTLTGRSQVWTLVWQAILRRPWLGYGFDSFWQGLKGESYRVISQVGWPVAHSHNGYLEALLGFGAIGCSLIAIAVLRAGALTLSYVRQERSVVGLWPLAFLAFYLAHATGEAGFITRDGFSYLLLVTLSTSLALRSRQKKAEDESRSEYSYARKDEVQILVPVLRLENAE